MSKGKRDALILTIIGLLLYGLAYYNFVLVDALAEVDDINSKISSAKDEKASLDNDLKNLAVLQRNVEIKNDQNERLEEYLMGEANLSDNIEYIDKLAKLFNDSFSAIKVGVPTKSVSKSTSTEYYEFAIDVEAKMPYSQAMNLVDYVEGGTRKVKISLFNLIPIAGGNTVQGAANAQAPENTTESMYSIKMQINLYALNLSNIDKVYEYSRKRFNNYSEGDGVIFVPGSSTISSTTGSGTASNAVNKPVTKMSQTITNGLDIEIRLGSFLLASQNFVVKGIGSQNPIKLRHMERPSVKITFNELGYNVNVIGGAGDVYDINGRINNDTIKMYVGANFPLDIPENQKLGADIQIVNNSNKRVDLDLEDKVRRVKITDRNGNLINSESDAEKVYII